MQFVGESKGLKFVADNDDRKRTALLTIFEPGVVPSPIEDPPAQIIKWRDVRSGMVYDSFEEYMPGFMEAHKLR